MLQKTLAGCAVLVLLGCHAPGLMRATKPIYPPAKVEVAVTVNADQSVTWGTVPEVHICVVKSKYPAHDPKDYCDRPYQVVWDLDLTDNWGGCGACKVWLIPKKPNQKNGKTFTKKALTSGVAYLPDNKVNYNVLYNREYGYALQVKNVDTPVGDPKDPDVMPHKPGG